jgi:hypothetical protein
MDLAEKRQKVVFAQTEHLNILDDHHLVVSHVEHRAQIVERTFHAFGSVQQAIPLRVLAETHQHFSHKFLQAGIG